MHLYMCKFQTLFFSPNETDSSSALSGQNQTTTSDDNSSSFTHNLNKERSFSSTWFWRIFGYGPPTEDGPEFIEMRNL